MNKYLTQIEAKLDLYFGKKAPAMPENIKEFIVKYSPYLYLVLLVITLPLILTAFGLTTIAMPFAYVSGLHSGFSFSFTALISLAALILGVMAVPGLFKRTKKSWQYMFYASLLSILSYLLNLRLGDLIINGIISFYILFQIKSYYKN
jgi:Na+/melibiose symporter-like transporter